MKPRAHFGRARVGWSTAGQKRWRQYSRKQLKSFKKRPRKSRPRLTQHGECGAHTARLARSLRVRYMMLRGIYHLLICHRRASQVLYPLPLFIVFVCVCDTLPKRCSFVRRLCWGCIFVIANETSVPKQGSNIFCSPRRPCPASCGGHSVDECSVEY